MKALTINAHNSNPFVMPSDFRNLNPHFNVKGRTDFVYTLPFRPLHLDSSGDGPSHVKVPKTWIWNKTQPRKKPLDIQGELL